MQTLEKSKLQVPINNVNLIKILIMNIIIIFIIILYIIKYFNYELTLTK